MDGGVIKEKALYLLNIIALILIGAFNLIDCISDRSPFLDYISYVAIFFILAAVLGYGAKKNKYKWNALLFAILGIGTIFGNEPANYSGAIFILYSFYIFNNTKTNIILFIAVSVSIVAKNIFAEIDINNTVNMFLVYTYVFLIYYILIHPKKPNIYTGLDEITREIIEYKMAGWSTKAVADKVCLSTDAVQKRISRACDKYEAGNLAQLVYKLMKKGYIST